MVEAGARTKPVALRSVGAAAVEYVEWSVEVERSAVLEWSAAEAGARTNPEEEGPGVESSAEVE